MPFLKHGLNSVTSGCKLEKQSLHFRVRDKGNYVALKGRGRDSMRGKPDVFEHTLHFLTKWAAPMQGVLNVTGTQDTKSSPLKMGPT